MTERRPRHLVYVITEDWFFASHFLSRSLGSLSANHEVTVITRCHESAAKLRDTGLNFVHFDFSRRGLNPFSEIYTTLKLKSLLTRLKPDIVHNIALKPIVHGTLAARMAGVKNIVNAPTGMGYVFTSTDFKARVVKPFVTTILRFVLSRNGSKIIIENEEDKENLINDRFADREDITLIKGSGVDTKKFTYEHEPKGEVKVAMISRLLRDKGVYEFIEAAKIIGATDKLTKFIIRGDSDIGNPTSISEDAIEDLSKSGNIVWLKERTEIAELLKSVHIVCLPSYREGLPMSLIEATAAGRPIVTTDVTGCREVVTDQVNGLLVPPRDGAALAAALLKLINDPEMRKVMGARNREKAEKEFANEIIIDQTLKVYESFYAS